VDKARIAGIERGCLVGQRPRSAGSNARLGAHGPTVRVPIVRLLADDGSSGFGLGRPTPDEASALLGAHLGAVFSPECGVLEMWLPFEYALRDFVAKHRKRPVYALAAAMAGRPPPGMCRVPCYDTSLYFDDLHLASDRDAAALIAAEAQEGYERGHRAFKIKVGRGARHMPLEEGTRREYSSPSWAAILLT
jgi:L-rhamnonate dehydratase